MLSQSHDLVSRGVDLPAGLISSIHTIFCVCVPQAIWLMVTAIAATIILRVANNVGQAVRRFSSDTAAASPVFLSESTL